MFKKIALSVVLTLVSLMSVALADNAKWDPYSPMPHDVVIGNPNAPITVVEYASLTCPHCGRFHRESMPAFKKEMVDTGKAKIIYRHFALDQSALAGALAVSCAPEALRSGVMEVLFDEVLEWAPDIKKMLPILQGKFGDKINSSEMIECVSNSELASDIVSGMIKAQTMVSKKHQHFL